MHAEHTGSTHNYVASGLFRRKALVDIDGRFEGLFISGFDFVHGPTVWRCFFCLWWDRLHDRIDMV
jgi:hypothetical protein